MKEKIKLIKGDITNVEADAIVNAANSSLMGGGGVDGAIHRAGGARILEECKRIVAKQGGCKTGEAVITTAGNLPARYVIHTVGPVWNGGGNNEKEKLYNCYVNSLKLAVENGCRSIAFPGISTGVYRFPKREAAAIAASAITRFLSQQKEVQIILVSFDNESYQCLAEAFEQYLLK